MIKLLLTEGFDVIVRRGGQPPEAAAPRSKSLRERSGDASWRYFLSTIGAFVAFGVLLRCCGAGWLA
jgi:hypothetical protein